MRSFAAWGLAAALAIASTAALGFQEQRSGGAPGAPAAAGVEKQMGVTEQAAPKASSGTEVRIPGLGKLGVLPKMDFGLELLYGAADPKSSAEPPPAREINPQDDDLTIRGTVKHRF
jgi:hypothetical protein